MATELLDETINQESVIEKQAEKFSRFWNNIIDSFFFLFMILFLNFMFSSFGIDIPNTIGIDGDILITIISLIYFSSFEYYTGKTPGKYLTNTSVVNKDGGKISFVEALVRSLCRLIPFEALSFVFGKRGWHDSFSNTYVINDN